MVVERLGHIASLSGTLVISFVLILLLSFMPETLGDRDKVHNSDETTVNDNLASYKPIINSKLFLTANEPPLDCSIRPTLPALHNAALPALR